MRTCKERDRHEKRPPVSVRLIRPRASSFLQILVYLGTILSISFASHISPASNTHQNPIQDLLNSENITKLQLGNNDITAGAGTSETPISGIRRKEPFLSAKCDSRLMSVSGAFGDPFKGRIYAYDYPDELDCGVTASSPPSPNITFHLPLGQCGIRGTVLNSLDRSVRHEVTLYIQYSSFLQQIVDERLTVSCIETQLGSSGEDKSNENPLTSVERMEEKPSSRQGRRLKHLARNLGLPKSNTNIGEAIMEIISGKDPSPKAKANQPVAVGEDVTLIVSTKVLRGYDARVVNCTTHDGSRHTSSDGSRVQPILDSAGCSVDRGLVPNFRRRRLPVESRNRLITLHFASFPAFKFPERDHLHIKCSVAYCQGPCPQESCESGINHYGSWRDKYGRIADVLVETAQVVNAIEVLSPELDSLGQGGHHYERHQSSSPPVGTVTASSATLALGDRSGGPDPYPQPQHPQQYGPYNGHHMAYNAQQQGLGNSPNPQPGPPAQANSPPHNAHSVCISPGTVILALVVLGLVLVISVTLTLWFALKRSEARKFALKSSPYNNPGPAPYYRFSHW